MLLSKYYMGDPVSVNLDINTINCTSVTADNFVYNSITQIIFMRCTYLHYLVIPK